MAQNKTWLRTLVCMALIASVFVVLPAAAQEADWLVTSERGTVGISSPAAGEAISGAAEIAGTATSPAFDYYKVEYSVDGDTWYPVDGADYRHEEQVSGDTLATWETTLFANGTYWLRAVVVDNTGNYVASEPIAVTISNVAAEEEAAAEEVEEAVVEEEEEAAEAPAAPPAPAAPSWLVTSERGTVGISSPAAGEAISGAAEIAGTATSPAFDYYKVEYSVDGDTWYPVDGADYRHEEQVSGDTLATWETTLFANGTYWLRAVVVDNTGNYVASEPIAVTISNVAAED
jgi:hypothetical protein